MTLAEIQAWLEANKGTPEVQNYLTGLKTPTLDGVKKFTSENVEGKAWLDSQKDTHHNKALETWKTNNLQALIDEEVKKKHPTKDPKEIEVENMKAEIEKMKKESALKDIKTNALRLAGEKKLPTELIDFFLGADETQTTANLGQLETVLNKTVTSMVEEKLKGGYKPPAGGGGADDSFGAKLAAKAAEAAKQAQGGKDYFA